MKNTFLLIAVLLVGACATTPRMKSVPGTYEAKKDGNTARLVFRENGKKDEDEGRWKIINKEILVKDKDGWVIIFRFNPDGGITGIKEIFLDVIQKDVPKEEQLTYIKIK